MILTMKICKKCGIEKSLSEYFNHPMTKDGKFATCKLCDKNRYNKWRKDNPEKRARIRKNEWLMKNYKITVEEYERLREKQNNRCNLCFEEPRVSRRKNGEKRLQVDHCHKTGKIRSLLCHQCNRALGLLNEDPVLLWRCINYLNEHKS